MPLPRLSEHDTVYREPVERLPGLVRVLAENPGPFTYTGTGTYILGGGQVAVLDPGPELDSHFDALMAALDGRTVSHILVTHTHLDHSPLAARLKAATGAPTFAYGAHGSGRTAGLESEEVEAGADTEFNPDHRLTDGEHIAGDGWTLKAHHTPGHTSNHMCLEWLETGSVFTGDHVMGWSSTIVAPPDGDMAAYMAGLDRLIGLNANRLIPTHGPMIEDASSYLQALKNHRLEREAGILRQLAAGADHIDAIVAALYSDVDAWLHPAAARSVLSHLIALCDREVVHCDGPHGLDARWQLAAS